jgi:hypothetical protein
MIYQSTYNGEWFTVTIDRSTAQRGYVLKTRNPTGEFISHNTPLKRKDFIDKFGFSPEPPHLIYFEFPEKLN